MSIKKFTIYGERCSGTNYLENIILLNFDVEITWNYGWKHFFGFDDLSNSDDTLFICIIRNPVDWINSFYRELHHHPLKLTKCNTSVKIHKFLNDEMYSIDDNGSEILKDRNIYTGERYKNIFELLHIKNKYLLEDLPNKVKNYIFIRYEDLLNNFINTMNCIKMKGLIVKSNISFPLNSNNYKKTNKIFVIKNKPCIISSTIIYNNQEFINYCKFGYIVFPATRQPYS